MPARVHSLVENSKIALSEIPAQSEYLVSLAMDIKLPAVCVRDVGWRKLEE
jgi:hypothetical protein